MEELESLRRKGKRKLAQSRKPRAPPHGLPRPPSTLEDLDRRDGTPFDPAQHSAPLLPGAEERFCFLRTAYATPLVQSVLVLSLS